jgi:glycosyltransferase involved in cell wall biosynthesis
MSSDVKPRLRVLHLGPSLDVRGGVSAVERLIAANIPAHIDFRHVPTTQDGPFSGKLRVYLRSIRATARELRASGPLLVHIHFASRGSTLRKFILALMVLRAGRPLVMHHHGAEFDQFFGRTPRLLRNLIADVLRRANYLVTLSRQWRDFFVARCGIAPEQIRVLVNPVRVPATLPDRRGRDRVQFLFLGRIGPRKGAFDLVRAFAALPEPARSRARLVIAGDGELQALRELAAPLGDSVRVLSWVDERGRDQLLAESDVFVLPSHAEGVSMAVLEAMAWGLPLITTAVGGLPDVVTHGQEGLIVTPGNVPEIRDALLRMIDDEPTRLELGRAARKRAEPLAIDGYRDRLLDLYRTLEEAAQSSMARVSSLSDRERIGQSAGL